MMRKPGGSSRALEEAEKLRLRILLAEFRAFLERTLFGDTLEAVAALEALTEAAGLRVVEFTHMVMGPTCGMILADLGAEVIKVEPLEGDNTRRLMGSGAGFFSTFNRNKRSLALDMKHPKGQEIAQKLVASADVLSENFKDGVMARWGTWSFTCAVPSARGVTVAGVPGWL